MALRPPLSLASKLNNQDVYELEGSPIPVEIDGKEIRTWMSSLQLQDALSTSSRLNEQSVISLLTEFLTVCLSSFGIKGSVFLHRTITTDGVTDTDDDDVETFASFWWSFGISITVLVLMMVGTLLVFYRRHQFILPRAPGTIASTMAYVHQGKVLYDLIGTEKLSKDRRLIHMDSLGKTYGFGWYSGRDGQVICGIDEEPLLQSYQHGVEFKTPII